MSAWIQRWIDVHCEAKSHIAQVGAQKMKVDKQPRLGIKASEISTEGKKLMVRVANPMVEDTVKQS